MRIETILGWYELRDNVVYSPSGEAFPNWTIDSAEGELRLTLYGEYPISLKTYGIQETLI